MVDQTGETGVTAVVRDDAEREVVLQGIRQLWGELEFPGRATRTLLPMVNGDWSMTSTTDGWAQNHASVVTRAREMTSRSAVATMVRNYNLLLEFTRAYAGSLPSTAKPLKLSKDRRGLPTVEEVQARGDQGAVVAAMVVVGLDVEPSEQTGRQEGDTQTPEQPDSATVVDVEAAPSGDGEQDDTAVLPPVPAAEQVMDHEDALRLRTQRARQWAEYRARRYRLLGQTVTAEEFWDEGALTSGVDEAPVGVTVSAEVRPSEEMARRHGVEQSKHAMVGRVNKALLSEAQQLVTDRLRSNGVVLGNKDGLVPQNVLVHALLLQLLGETAEVEVSENNRLVGIAAQIGDRRYDEVNLRLDQVEGTQDTQTDLLETVAQLGREQARNTAVTQRLVATLFAERLGVEPVRPHGSVSGVHADAAGVSSLLERVGEQTAGILQREYEKEHRM